LDEDVHRIKNQYNLFLSRASNTRANLVWANTYISGYVMHISVGIVTCGM